jgi:hypothetical protein
VKRGERANGPRLAEGVAVALPRLFRVTYSITGGYIARGGARRAVGAGVGQRLGARSGLLDQPGRGVRRELDRVIADVGR